MKKNTTSLTNSTAVSIFLITVVAIAAVFVATYQVDRGPVAPTAPLSQPQAADITSTTCRLDFEVVAIDTVEADLRLRKIPSNSTPSVGEEITFTISLTNVGPDTATGVTVEDLLPEGLTFRSSYSAQGEYIPGTGIWNVGTIEPNETLTLSMVVRVDVGTQIVNTAQVESSEVHDPTSVPGNDNPAEDDQASATLNPVTPGADLQVKKSVNTATPQVGDTVTFTIEVHNSGPAQATGVTLIDLIPSGLTYENHSTANGSYDRGTGIWNVGTIPNNATYQLQIVAKVDTESSVRNIAQVQTSDQPDPNSTPGNNNPAEDDYDYKDVHPTQTGADLSLTKRVNNAAPNVGDEIIFTLEVRNAGPNEAKDVIVKDQLPPGLKHLGSSPSQGNYDASTGEWYVGSISRGATARMDMRIEVQSTNQVRNIAEVWRSSEPDPDSTPANNNPAEDDYDEVVIGRAGLPKSGENSRTTMFVVATGIVVLIIGAMGLLLFL